jgi:hypothetical protein
MLSSASVILTPAVAFIRIARGPVSLDVRLRLHSDTSSEAGIDGLSSPIFGSQHHSFVRVVRRSLSFANPKQGTLVFQVQRGTDSF